ncbi:MAG: acyl-CoA thioesterase [Bdellovibrionota bacterium]
MERVIANDKTMEMTVLMTPDLVNFSGKVHGGAILKFLDLVAYACASRYSGHYVVTLAVDQVLFRHPVHVGELVIFLANVNYTGKSSMEVGIKVVSEDTKTRKRTHVLSSFFTMVALDENSKPVPVPQLALVTEKDKQRHEGALGRKKHRELTWTQEDEVK